MKKQDYKLRAHYNNRDHYDYSFKTKEWMHNKFSPLSRRQIEMLVWAQQGLSLKDTADKMNISFKTVENMRHELFDKWKVISIEQALQYASNHRNYSDGKSRCMCQYTSPWTVLCRID